MKEDKISFIGKISSSGEYFLVRIPREVEDKFPHRAAVRVILLEA